MDKAREAAVRVLFEVHELGAYANVALGKALKAGRFTETDRRFLTELVYGAVKAGDTLDWMLKKYITRPLSKMQPTVREILRLGIYQLFFLDKVPPSAVCNTSVELAKCMGFLQLSGMVNGILRTAVREPERAAFPEGKGRATEGLALRAMHPFWLVKHWVKEFGFHQTEALCRFNNEEPVLSLRVNTLRATRDDIMKRLAVEGVKAESSSWAPEGIRILSHGSLDAMKALQEGYAQVQDESSMLVAHILHPNRGDFVIDACAAPGGKATHIAAQMGDAGHVLACDIYEHKLARIRENAKRLGITSITPVLLDAREIGAHYAGRADAVLVDAPCSGLGVLRRKGDARWRKTLESLKELPTLQLAILESAAKAVKTGGTLVYSTCTIERKENRDIIESFLAAHEEFMLEKAGNFLPEITESVQLHREDDMIQLMPHVDNTDGFFIARMRRR